MDVSTLFAAPNTAASTAALSFGALAGNGGNATAPGDGLEGLDSFNQLLGNFLSLTGGEMSALPQGDSDLAGDGTGTALAVPPGMAALPGTALLKGAGALAGLAGNGIQGKGVEGRWAQSGLNLLAGGGLTGQEMNPEVLDFLNDLSSVIAASSAMGDAAVAVTDGAAGSTTGIDLETDATETLIVLQGDVTVPTAAPAMPTPASAPVIPLTVTVTAPATTASASVMTLTTAGTGLQSLPTVPAPEDSARPAAAPVIPRVATATSPLAGAIPAMPAQPAPTPETTSAVPAAIADTAPPAHADLADDAVVTPMAAKQPAPATDAAKQVGAMPAAPMATGPATDERTAAIAVPAELAATAADDNVPVTLPAAADVPSLPKIKAPDPAPSTSAAPAMVTPAPAEAPAAPVLKTAAAAPAATPVLTAPAVKQGGDKKAEAVTVTQDASASSVPPAAETQTQAPSVAEATAPKAASSPAAPVKATSETVKSTKAPSSTVAMTTIAPPATETTETTDTGEPANADLQTIQTGPSARPGLTATRPATAQPQAQAKAAVTPSPSPVTDETAEAAPVETEEVTNQRMLAPKHVSSEARAEAQADMAGPAQTAGQNSANARPDATPPTVNGEREDNLLTRAVTAAGKARDAGGGTEGEAGSGADTGAATDLSDNMTGTLSMADPAKAQGSDFAQSLRQTAAPHRPNAYMPPTHQMAMQVQRAVQEGNERLSIRLNPQELGRIDVQLEIGTEGKLRAKVMVENPQTLEMLQKDSKTLEKALQDAGLQTDQNSLSFSLQDSGDQAQQRQDQRDEAGYGTALASTDDEQEDPAILAQTQILELGRVDVRV